MIMANTTTRPSARPAQDEWGVFDPQQAGLAALFARLDSKNAKAKAEAKAESTAATAALPRPTLRDAQ